MAHLHLVEHQRIAYFLFPFIQYNTPVYSHFKPTWHTLHWILGKNFVDSIKKTVLIGPLPRYVVAGCCGKAAHISNRRAPRFLEDMLEDLEGIHKTTRDFLFKENLRHIRVMNPWVGLRDMLLANIWGDNPIQIKQEAMVQLAEGVKITLNKITIKRRRDSMDPAEQKRNRGWSGGGGGSGGRGLGGAAWGAGRSGRK
jgi:hypothetical protein